MTDISISFSIEIWFNGSAYGYLVDFGGSDEEAKTGKKRTISEVKRAVARLVIDRISKQVKLQSK